MNTDRMGSRGNVNACVCIGGGGVGRRGDERDADEIKSR